MKKYLSILYSSHEYAPANYAYVELDDKLRQFLAAVTPHIAQLGSVRGRSFLRAEFLDYTPTFLEALPAHLAAYEDKICDGELCELPADTEPPAADIGLDFATIQVEDDCFRWSCRVKHSPAEQETVNFNFKDVGWPELDTRKPS